jgi:hypothetical protein
MNFGSVLTHLAGLGRSPQRMAAPNGLANIPSRDDRASVNPIFHPLIPCL